MTFIAKSFSGKGVQICLNEYQMHTAALVGVQRQIESCRPGWKHKHNAPKEMDSWQTHIEGAMGEMCVAIHLGIYWDKGERGMPDVGNDEVRTSRYMNGVLILHRSDCPDRRHWLVTGENGVYVVRGWILTRTGQDEKYWGTLRNQKNRPAFLVPQKDLNFNERNPCTKAHTPDLFAGNGETVPDERGNRVDW